MKLNTKTIAGNELKGKPNLDDILKEWITGHEVYSADVFTQSEAIRAEASIASWRLKSGPRYLEGIYLLYPQTKEQNDSNNGGSMTSYFFGSDKPNIDFDIVLLHGVTGSPFNTW